MNINTTVGLLQRYVSDWAGPEAVFRSIKVRLGAPNYPGDTMTFSGSVQAVDPAASTATVAVFAFRS